MGGRISEIVERVFQLPSASLTAESGPHTIAAWDSAGHLKLILELEKQFSIQFDDEEVSELISVPAISAALFRHGCEHLT